MSTQDSVHAALSCDDILCEILLRLPGKCIFKFLIVSKQWLHLICSSSFRRSYLTRWRGSFNLLGFFMNTDLYLRPRESLRRPHWEPALPFLSTCKQGNNLKFSGFLNRLGYFIDSSHDVLLCGFHPKTYYVCNPITRQLVQLPQPRMTYRVFCMTLVFKECFGDVFCCKVIRANCEYTLDEVNTVSIETFSSKTGMWEPSTLTCSSTFLLCPSPATVIRGVIHWWATGDNVAKVAVYDPSLGEERLALIKLPGELLHDCNESILGESVDGRLQYGQSDKLGMEIWVQEKDLSNGWNLRYKLSFKTMWKENPTTIFGKPSKKSAILSFLPQNSESILIRSGQSILLYHLKSGRLEVVQYCSCGFSIRWDFYKVIPYFIPALPCIPALPSTQ